LKQFLLIEFSEFLRLVFLFLKFRLFEFFSSNFFYASVFFWWFIFFQLMIKKTKPFILFQLLLIIIITIFFQDIFFLLFNIKKSKYLHFILFWIKRNLDMFLFAVAHKSFCWVPCAIGIWFVIICIWWCWFAGMNLNENFNY